MGRSLAYGREGIASPLDPVSDRRARRGDGDRGDGDPLEGLFPALLADFIPFSSVDRA